MSALLEKLLAAKKAYFTGGDSGFTDEEYDQLEATVRREYADNPAVLAQIDATGWSQESGKRLPILMPSLAKGKPGEELLKRFLASSGPIIVSEKLDGISALWDAHESRLYNRGDGVSGTDLTAFIPYIRGLPSAAGADLRFIRGEIMLAKADADPETPSRSQVNGALHREAGEVDLPLRFVAYQVCTAGASPSTSIPSNGRDCIPAMPRLQQFRALTNAGYEVPWNKAITSVSEETEQELAALLRERKGASDYDIDGLVIGRALVKPLPIELRNGEAVIPKDMIAFKMPLSEQQARTTIRDVEWNCSRFNVYAPRLVIEPVRIGGALITYITGHNAKFMLENGLGVGAEITVLRSGDVIPIVYQVHKKAVVKLPSDVWDATRTNVLATEASAEQRAAHLENALKVLDVEGAGPAAAVSLVEADITSIEEILHTPADVLGGILGPGKGPQLLSRLKAAIRKAPIHTLILASQDVPKGTGNAKLLKMIQTYPNWNKWNVQSKPPANWSATTWEEFCDAWTEIEEEIKGWKEAIGEDMAAVEATVAITAKSAAKKSAAAGGGVCMTGFRDKALAAASEAAGYTADDNVKKTTKFLIIPDDEDPETVSTGKAVKARENGARIMRASEWKKYLQDK